MSEAKVEFLRRRKAELLSRLERLPPPAPVGANERQDEKAQEEEMQGKKTNSREIREQKQQEGEGIEMPANSTTNITSTTTSITTTNIRAHTHPSEPAARGRVSAAMDKSKGTHKIGKKSVDSARLSSGGSTSSAHTGVGGIHQREKEKLVRSAFRTTRPLSVSKSPYPAPPATRFVRADSRQLQGEQTRILLPSHPVLSATSMSASSRPVPIQLLNHSALLRRKPILPDTRERGIQTVSPPQVVPRTSSTHVQTDEVSDRSDVEDAVVENVNREETLEQVQPNETTPEEEDEKELPVPVAIVASPAPAPLHQVPSQATEWTLEGSGPMILPPDVLLNVCSSEAANEDDTSSDCTTCEFIHVADLTKEDMPAALFQPPPPIWLQKQAEMNALTKSVSASAGTSQFHEPEDFSLGQARRSHSDRLQRDPFAFWRETSANIGYKDHAAHRLDIDKVVRRANAIERDFKESEFVLQQLQEIVDYEDEFQRGNTGENKTHLIDEDDARGRYLRFDAASGKHPPLKSDLTSIGRVANMVNTSGHHSRKEVDSDSEQEYNEDLVSARNLMAQLEAHLGLEDAVDEVDDESIDTPQRDSVPSRRSSRRASRYSIPKPLHNSDAPSPSRDYHPPKIGAKIHRRSRIPSSMSRRSKEIVIKGRKHGRKGNRHIKSSVRHSVEKKVKKMQAAKGVFGRVQAALDLARVG